MNKQLKPQIVDLTCPFDREYSVPQYLHHNWRIEFKPLFTYARDGQRVMEFRMSTHTGTHVDAPSHVLKNGKTLDELPLSSFYGPGIVLDVQKGELGEIDDSDLEKADFGIREGDIVLLYTGWGKYFVEEPKDPYYLASRHPGVSVRGAEWLVAKKIKAVGIDVFSVRPPAKSELQFDRVHPGTITERMPIRGIVEKVHDIFLSKDIVLLEQLINLDQIVGKRLTISFFPLPMTGMDGAPVRAVAFVD